MWTFSKKINYFCYKVFASWLPISQRSQFSKKIRVHFAKRIAKLGKNVNIERNAYFSPDVIVGDNSGIGINCELYGPIEIGDNVLMGPEVIMYTSGHRYERVDIPIILQGSTDIKKIIIASYCN